jgi:hypothetical protein
LIDTIPRIAPADRFRLIGIDTFDNQDWLEGDFADQAEAMKLADEKGGTMLLMEVYDDQGKIIHKTGTF